MRIFTTNQCSMPFNEIGYRCLRSLHSINCIIEWSKSSNQWLCQSEANIFDAEPNWVQVSQTESNWAVCEVNVEQTAENSETIASDAALSAVVSECQCQQFWQIWWLTERVGQTMHLLSIWYRFCWSDSTQLTMSSSYVSVPQNEQTMNVCMHWIH